MSIEDQQPDAKQRLTNLCNFYGIAYEDSMYQSWINLVNKILTEDNVFWCRIKGSQPSAFWMAIFNQNMDIHPNLLW